jgi:hypothetical protein
VTLVNVWVGVSASACASTNGPSSWGEPTVVVALQSSLFPMPCSEVAQCAPLKSDNTMRVAVLMLCFDNVAASGALGAPRDGFGAIGVFNGVSCKEADFSGSVSLAIGGCFPFQAIADMAGTGHGGRELNFVAQRLRQLNAKPRSVSLSCNETQTTIEMFNDDECKQSNSLNSMIPKLKAGCDAPPKVGAPLPIQVGSLLTSCAPRKSGSDTSLTKIIGAIIVGLVLCGAIAVGIVMLVRYRRSHKQEVTTDVIGGGTGSVNAADHDFGAPDDVSASEITISTDLEEGL